VSTSFFMPDVANHVPHLKISWDSRISLTPQQVSQLLRKATPPIAMSGGEEKPGLAINSFMLQPGEDQIVADQLSRILREHAA